MPFASSRIISKDSHTDCGDNLRLNGNMSIFFFFFFPSSRSFPSLPQLRNGSLRLFALALSLLLDGLLDYRQGKRKSLIILSNRLFLDFTFFCHLTKLISGSWPFCSSIANTWGMHLTFQNHILFLINPLLQAKSHKTRSLKQFL